MAARPGSQRGQPDPAASLRPVPWRVLILKPCCLGDVLLATPLAVALSSESAAHRLAALLGAEHAGSPASQEPTEPIEPIDRADPGNPGDPAHPDGFDSADGPDRASAAPEPAGAIVLDWAVDAHSRPALAGNPLLGERLDASHCIRGDLRLGALLGLAWRIRRRRYDAIFVPDRSPLLSLVARLSGAPLRVGLASAWRGFGYTRRVPAPPDRVRHEAELYLDLARAIGIDPGPPRMVFVPSPPARARALSLLAPGATPGLEPARRSVAIHPGGGVNPGMALLEKRWPAERFAQLAARFLDQAGVDVCLLGGPGDRPVVDALLAALGPDGPRSGRLIDLCGQLTLDEAAALIERCALYVGNDSGLAHLAAASRTPALVLFGPTDPARYGPLPGRGQAIGPTEAGAPAARLAEARGSRAIDRIGIEAVWRSATELLGESGAGRAGPAGASRALEPTVDAEGRTDLRAHVDLEGEHKNEGRP